MGGVIIGYHDGANGVNRMDSDSIGRYGEMMHAGFCLFPSAPKALSGAAFRRYNKSNSNGAD